MKLPPFQTLLDAHGCDVHAYLVALVGAGDADDCYQETWISALRAYPRLRHADNLRGWVLTIAHRKAIDCFRERRRAPTLTGEALAEHPLGERPAEVLAVDERGPLAAVRRLPDKQRAAVALRILLDADYSAVAAAMGTTEAAARRNVHEGLKKLRDEYRRNEAADDEAKRGDV